MWLNRKKKVPFFHYGPFGTENPGTIIALRKWVDTILFGKYIVYTLQKWFAASRHCLKTNAVGCLGLALREGKIGPNHAEASPYGTWAMPILNKCGLVGGVQEYRELKSHF